MKAMVHHEYGAPKDVLRLAEVETPVVPLGTLIQSYGDGDRWFGPVGSTCSLHRVLTGVDEQRPALGSASSHRPDR